MPPVKIIVYDFLRRHYPHQVIGSKVIPSSQPVSTSSPVFICMDYTPSVRITQDAIMLKMIVYEGVLRRVRSVDPWRLKP